MAKMTKQQVAHGTSISEVTYNGQHVGWTKLTYTRYTDDSSYRPSSGKGGYIAIGLDQKAVGVYPTQQKAITKLAMLAGVL